MTKIIDNPDFLAAQMRRDLVDLQDFENRAERLRRLAELSHVSKSNAAEYMQRASDIEHLMPKVTWWMAKARRLEREKDALICCLLEAGVTPPQQNVYLGGVAELDEQGNPFVEHATLSTGRLTHRLYLKRGVDGGAYDIETCYEKSSENQR